VKKPSLAVLRGTSLDAGSHITRHPQSQPLGFQSAQIKGKLPPVQLNVIRRDFKNEQISENMFIKSETNPYAIGMANINDFDDSKLKLDHQHQLHDQFETYSGIIGEPAYMIKTSMDCNPNTSSSNDYKMIAISSQSQSQCHSQCSSNHEELIRAYEFGRQQRLNPTTSEPVSCVFDDLDELDDGFYRSLASDRDTPTDPGLSLLICDSE